MNILTFDIEEWYMKVVKMGWRDKRAEYDRYFHRILDKLDERSLKATFFCLGEMGRLFPETVLEIDRRGHEVGCHSNVHLPLNTLTKEECLDDTRKALDSLEQCLGKKIISYRAPAFSVGEENRWMFSVLTECGIERDSSVYPARRDYGGFPDFGTQRPALIKVGNSFIKEFPIPLAMVAGKQFAYSGGGYFRVLPYGFIRRQMMKSDYTMTYFHLDDLLPESKGVMSAEEYRMHFNKPGTLIERYRRCFRANVGKKGAMDKLMRLLDEMDFIGLSQADGQIKHWDVI